MKTKAPKLIQWRCMIPQCRVKGGTRSEPCLPGELPEKWGRMSHTVMDEQQRAVRTETGLIMCPACIRQLKVDRGEL